MKLRFEQTNGKRWRPISALFTVLLLTTACLSTARPKVFPDALATIVAGTLTAITPLASQTAPATPIPSTPIPPATIIAPTSIPPTAVLPGATRINFATGATYSAITGSVQSGQSQNFALKAQQGQSMTVMVDSPSQGATIAIKTQTGVTLLDAAKKWTNWRGILPATQEYYITVVGGSGTENFTLAVSIPARIRFAAGTDSATVSGKTAGGYAVSYILYASAGQKMTVKLSGAGGDAALTIYGFTDGQPYLRAQSEVTEWEQPLPSTQDYVVEVVPRAGQVVNYTLTVKIK